MKKNYLLLRRGKETRQRILYNGKIIVHVTRKFNRQFQNLLRDSVPDAINLSSRLKQRVFDIIITIITIIKIMKETLKMRKKIPTILRL